MSLETSSILWNETTKCAVLDSSGYVVGYKCRFCRPKSKRITARPDYFKLYLQRQHYIELNIQKPPKNVKCPHDECESTFYTNGQLKAHIRTHTNKNSTKNSTANSTAKSTATSSTLSSTNDAFNSISPSKPILDQTHTQDEMQFDEVQYLVDCEHNQEDNNDNDDNLDDNEFEVTSSTDGTEVVKANDSVERSLSDAESYVFRDAYSLPSFMQEEEKPKEKQRKSQNIDIGYQSTSD